MSRRHSTPSQTRARKLRKERQRRFAIADTVHRAVCQYTHSDGVGRCALYSLCGFVLTTLVLGQRYVPQAGALYLHADPKKGPDGWIAFEPQHAGMERGEYHCWLIGPDLGQP